MSLDIPVEFYDIIRIKTSLNDHDARELATELSNLHFQQLGYLIAHVTKKMSEEKDDEEVAQ